ncbi:MAG: DUF885 domain-containing protein [Clostridium sp.]|nr:DUF885 domain-containing protein [Clostridium sp.]MCM1399074.1 DUF885 domain-containing protein [Clostridium sp.]MCM1459465.1 DUF885 domain-containing protein [Bacteroides sp.]
MFKFNTKKIISVLLVSALTLSLAGCGKKDDTASSDDPITTTADAQIISTNTDPVPDVPYVEYVEEKENPDSEEALAEQQKFEDYLAKNFEDTVTQDTVTLHYSLAYPEKMGIEAPEVTYGDVNMDEEALAEEEQETKDSIAELEAINPDLLTTDQQFTYNILMEYLQTSLLSYENIYLYEPFAYTSGIQSNLPITISEYKFYDRDDVDDYIRLLQITPDYITPLLEFEQIKSDKGLFMSSNSASEVIRQCNEFIAEPEKNLLIETFNDRIGDVAGLSDEEIESYKQANHDAVINNVIPTYEAIISKFEELQDTGKNDLGLCNFDGGKEYYEYLLKSKVGSTHSADEICTLLDERINATMEDLTTLAMGNYDDIMSYYDEYENFYQDVDPKETIEFFEEAFSKRFPEIPEIDFTITPVHDSLVDMVSPAFYMTPPLDAYEDNVIHTNMESDGAGALWSTLAHEGVPGHMYQFVYFLSGSPTPLRTLLNFNGYQEGWASYVEMMSFDYYDFSKDTYAEVERINTKLNLLLSARIDIGVNYEGWTKDETADFLNNNGFNGAAAQDIIDYVVAEPCNYQMYCIGWLEFQLLRELAETELGDKFNERNFHQVVLDAGPCQFKFVKEKVEKYIDATK